jgi:hypothetical protein
MSSPWLDAAMRTNRKVRPIRELTTEDIQLFLAIESARNREAKRLDVHKSAGGLVLITVMFGSIFAFVMGAIVQWAIAHAVK